MGSTPALQTSFRNIIMTPPPLKNDLTQTQILSKSLVYRYVNMEINTYTQKGGRDAATGVQPGPEKDVHPSALKAPWKSGCAGNIGEQLSENPSDIFGPT